MSLLILLLNYLSFLYYYQHYYYNYYYFIINVFIILLLLYHNCYYYYIFRNIYVHSNSNYLNFTPYVQLNQYLLFIKHSLIKNKNAQVIHFIMIIFIFFILIYSHIVNMFLFYYKYHFLS